MHYHNITKEDMLNGDGLRTVLWVSGCSHGCEECHNPITWDIHGGVPFDQAARNELFLSLDRPYISGLTISGGDPLHPDNRECIGGLISAVREKLTQKTIWLYTGYEWDEIRDLPLLSGVDVVVDGRFDVELKDPKLHWRGSSNQRVIDVALSLRTKTVVLHGTYA